MWLDLQTLKKVVEAAGGEVAITTSRLALVPAALSAQIPILPVPAAQLMVDLRFLAEQERPEPLMAWLEVAAMLAPGPKAEMFDQIRERIAASRDEPATAAADPLRSQLFSGDAASLLDRGAFRDTLQRMAAEPEPMALVVSGPSRSGRSRSGEFLKWYANKLGEPCTFLRGVRGDTPRSLLERFEAELWTAGADRVSSLADPIKHREAGNLLVRWVRAQSQRWWLILDELHGLAPEMVELVHGLVATLGGSSVSSRLRLVLIGWEGPFPFPGVSAGLIQSDPLTHDLVGDAQIEAFVEWVYRTSGKQLPIDTRKAAVADILPPPDIGLEARLAHIDARALALARAVRGR